MQVHIGAIGHGGRTKRQDLERFTRACLPFFLTEDELGTFMKQATCSIEVFKASLKRFERKIHPKITLTSRITNILSEKPVISP